MYIAEVSDLHVTHWNWDIDWAATKDARSDVLIIAGDTSNDVSTSMRVIKEAASHYPHVIFCSGNHEHYSSKNRLETVSDADRFIEQTLLELGYENVTFLNGPQSILIQDVLFVGANGWYDFTLAEGYSREQQHDCWKQNSNDPMWIRFAPGGYPDKLAARQAAEIAQIVAGAQDDDRVRQIVVVTHTAPLFRCLRTTSIPDWDCMNGAYGNAHMQEVVVADVKGKISNWFFGHTHHRNDFYQDGIRYISAPRGYQGERHLNWERPLLVDTDEEEVGSAFGEVEKV